MQLTYVIARKIILMRYLKKIASKLFDDYFQIYLQYFFEDLVSIMAQNKFGTELKYKIYQPVWGLINELKIASEKLSQLLAIH